MNGEKPRQGFSGYNWATEHQVDQFRPDDGHTSHDGRADSESPVRILVESQHLPRERHAKRHQQKKHAYNPGELARKLERTKEKDLHQVNDYQSNHEVGAPAMERANKPSKRLLIVEGLEAV